MIYLIVASTILLNVAANVFLKIGMKDFGGVAVAGAILHMMKTPSVYLAVFFYGF